MSSYIIVFDTFRNEIIHDDISKLISLLYCMYKYTHNIILYIYIYMYVCMYVCITLKCSYFIWFNYRLHQSCFRCIKDSR